MTRREGAESLFSEGFNCAQAILATFGTGLGIERDTALRLASALGAGIARSGHVCGAVTGAIMVIGLRFGSTDPGEELQKEELMEKAAGFLEKFAERHGSIRCCDLVGLDLSTQEGRDEALRRNVFDTVCVKFVSGASEILDEMI